MPLRVAENENGLSKIHGIFGGFRALIWLLFILHTSTYAAIVYPYNIGNINASCPSGWSQFGTHCFQLVNHSLPFYDASFYCRSPNDLNAVPFHIDNYFLVRTIVEGLDVNNSNFRDLTQQTIFWTGLYLLNLPDNTFPYYINRTFSYNWTSIYNPLWASNEPDPDFRLQQLTDSNITCIAIDMDLRDETNYGWQLHDCSDRLPFLCQTFVCYDDDFRCHDNSGCAPSTALCDGFKDCQDGSDEPPIRNCNSTKKCECGRQLYKEKYGTIYSPGFNGECSETIDCTYRIQQEPAARIYLNFITLNINELDSLVLEGADSSERVPISSDQKSFSYLSSGNELTIRFNHRNGRGFHLQYVAEDSSSCIHRFESWNGTFSPPRRLPENGRYKNQLDCTWTITNKGSGMIGLQIPYFDLALPDWLVIYDGEPIRANLVGNFTVFNTPPTAFASDSLEISFQFHSSPNSNGANGFQAIFKQSCLNERLTSPYGIIESPNFRNPTKRKPFHCSWIIQVPCRDYEWDCEFSLFFDNLNLTNKDWITIDSGSDLVTIDAFSLPILMHRSKVPKITIDMYAENWQFATKISYSIDCPPPILSDPYTVMTVTEPHRFAYRSLVSFHCLSGYSLNGHSTVQCQLGGKWSHAVPTCLSSTCVVPNIQNGFVASLNRSTNMLSWSCMNGYWPDKIINSTCYGSSWNPLPKCNEVKCHYLPDKYPNDTNLLKPGQVPARLKRSTDSSNILNGYYEYVCDDGYVMRGRSPPYFVCNIDGWVPTPFNGSEKQFYCQAPGCYAQNVLYGNFNHSWVPVNSTNPIVCIEGYIPDGVAEVKCTYKDGNVVLDPPGNYSCKFNDLCNLDCGHGKCKTLNGTETCDCDPGYYMNTTLKKCTNIDECALHIDLCDNVTSYCQDTDGSYDCVCRPGYQKYYSYLSDLVIPNREMLISNRSCIRSRCIIPDNYTAYQDISNHLYLVNTSITFYCPREVQSWTETCMIGEDGGGQWNSKGQINFCNTDFTCPRPNITDATLVDPDQSNYPLFQRVSFRCAENHTLIGPNEAMCVGNRTWTSSAPICTRPTCEKLTPPPHMSMEIITNKNWTIGTVVKFTCEYPYERNTSTLTCINNTDTHQPFWKGRLPTCEDACKMETFDDLVVPSVSSLRVGESATFKCLQPNYVLSGKTSTTCIPATTPTRVARSVSPSASSSTSTQGQITGLTTGLESTKHTTTTTEVPEKTTPQRATTTQCNCKTTTEIATTFEATTVESTTMTSMQPGKTSRSSTFESSTIDTTRFSGTEVPTTSTREPSTTLFESTSTLSSSPSKASTSTETPTTYQSSTVESLTSTEASSTSTQESSSTSFTLSLSTSIETTTNGAPSSSLPGSSTTSKTTFESSSSTSIEGQSSSASAEMSTENQASLQPFTTELSTSTEKPATSTSTTSEIVTTSTEERSTSVKTSIKVSTTTENPSTAGAITTEKSTTESLPISSSEGGRVSSSSTTLESSTPSATFVSSSTTEMAEESTSSEKNTPTKNSIFSSTSESSSSSTATQTSTMSSSMSTFETTSSTTTMTSNMATSETPTVQSSSTSTENPTSTIASTSTEMLSTISNGHSSMTDTTHFSSTIEPSSTVPALESTTHSQTESTATRKVTIHGPTKPTKGGSHSPTISTSTASRTTETIQRSSSSSTSDHYSASSSPLFHSTSSSSVSNTPMETSTSKKSPSETSETTEMPISSSTEQFSSTGWNTTEINSTPTSPMTEKTSTEFISKPMTSESTISETPTTSTSKSTSTEGGSSSISTNIPTMIFPSTSENMPSETPSTSRSSEVSSSFPTNVPTTDFTSTTEHTSQSMTSTTSHGLSLSTSEARTTESSNASSSSLNPITNGATTSSASETPASTSAATSTEASSSSSSNTILSSTRSEVSEMPTETSTNYESSSSSNSGGLMQSTTIVTSGTSGHTTSKAPSSHGSSSMKPSTTTRATKPHTTTHYLGPKTQTPMTKTSTKTPTSRTAHTTEPSTSETPTSTSTQQQNSGTNPITSTSRPMSTTNFWTRSATTREQTKTTPSSTATPAETRTTCVCVSTETRTTRPLSTTTTTETPKSKSYTTISIKHSSSTSPIGSNVPSSTTDHSDIISTPSSTGHSSTTTRAETTTTTEKPIVTDPTTCKGKKCYGGNKRKSKEDEDKKMDFMVDNLLRKARSAEVDHTLERNIHSGKCITDWGGVSNAYVGSSVMFFCTISPKCRNYDTKWIDYGRNETISTTQNDLTTTLSFDSIQMSDQGEYVCQVSKDDNIIDSITFFLSVSDSKKEESWAKIWTHLENGSWSFSMGNSSGENYLISPPLRVENDWLEITTELAACEKCQITAYNFSSDRIVEDIPLKEFHRLGTLSADRASSYSTQFQIPNSLLWIMLKVSGNTDNITLKGVNLKVPTCPKLRLGLTEYSETIAGPNSTFVEGRCVEKAVRKAFKPQLLCTKFGTWSMPPAGTPVSACFCSEGFVDYFGECVRKGPICYECGPAPLSECNSTAARHCDVGETCRSRVQFFGSVPMVEKSCAKNCVDNFKDFDKCQTGQEECTLCCDTDYCTPMNPVKRPIRLSVMPPSCIDQQPMELKCVPKIEVQQIGSNVYQPTIVPWPEVIDNDPNYIIFSNLPDLSSTPYLFDGSQNNLVWTAVDRHGVESQCVTKIEYQCHDPPSIECPEIYLDYMTGTTSRQAFLWLPEIQVNGSATSLVTEPPNGTLINLEVPLLVSVTALDAIGNSAKCQFWYMAVPSDCPLWKIDPNEFLCTQAENVTICYRQKPCLTKQIPVDFKAIACAPGQGWRYVQNEVIGSDLSNEPAMIRQPMCMEEQSSIVTLSLTFDLARKQNDCNNPLLESVRNIVNNIIAKTCPNVVWHLTQVTTEGSNITLNYTTNGRETSPILNCIQLIDQTVTSEKLGLVAPCLPRIRAHSMKYHLECINGWGSDSNLKCELCAPGFFTSANSCSECPKGSYSTSFGAFACQPCPPGKSTLNTGASSSDECIDACGPGFYSKTGLGPCKACQKGTYQSLSGQTTCLSCFFNVTTAETAAKSEDECRPKCQAGSFGKSGIELCQQCPMGYYQEESGASECEKCPQGTRTLTAGADSRFQCTVLSCDAIGCQNGGTCQDGTCQCQVGFAGADCSVVMNLCNAAYCVNGGSCSFDPSTGASCICPPNFSGQRCETEIQKEQTFHDFTSSLTIDCSNPNACPNGRCQNDTCICNHGYVLNNTISKCEKEDPCKWNPCRNQSTQFCLSVQDEFICQCQKGWAGTFCEISMNGCSNISDWENSCKNGGTCVMMPVGDGFIGKCLCPPGYNGTYCDYGLDLKDTCSGVNCGNGTCVPVGYDSDDYYCNCTEGYFGEFCDTVKSPCSYEVSNHTCLNGGTCSKTDSNSYKCDCPDGFAGDRCETETSLCDTTSPCKNGGKCHFRFRDYFCTCPPGYTGVNCTEAINPCKVPFDDSNPCGSGQCHNISFVGYEPRYNCSCNSKWNPNGENHCRTPAQTCNSNDAKSTCGPYANNCSSIPQVGNNLPDYTCYCQSNYSGHGCHYSLNYCRQDTKKDLCNGKGQCINRYNGTTHTYECGCWSNVTGANCEQPKDACLGVNCGHGNCVSHGDDYYCDCNPGWDHGNGTKACTIGKNYCNGKENYCQNGICQFSEEFDYTYCDCHPGYTGQYCENEFTSGNYSYNLYFTGNPTDYNQTIHSIAIGSSFMREFSICGWVFYGADGSIKRVSELAEESQPTLPPYAILGLWNGTDPSDPWHGDVTMPLITFRNTGVRVEGHEELKSDASNFTLYAWHHFCLVSPRQFLPGWRYYLDGRIVAQNNRTGISPDGRVSILLGQNIEGTERFVGQMSLIQFFGKSLNDSDVASMAFDCHNYVTKIIMPDERDLIAINWNQFTPTRRFNEAILTIYPGICLLESCLPGQPDCTKDKMPPIVNSCPLSRYVNVTERLAKITWEESYDMFTDNNYVVELTSNFRSGQSFTWGFYHVVYKARDANRNLATCEFDVVLSKYFCVPPVTVDTKTTQVNVTETVTESTRMQANLVCLEPGYVFNQKIPQFYTCDYMGRWKRSDQNSYLPIKPMSPMDTMVLYLPACSSTTNPNQLLDAIVQIYDLCENRASLEQTVKQLIWNASQLLSDSTNGQQKICENTDCSNVLITSNCTEGGQFVQTRKKRLTESVPIYVSIKTTGARQDITPYVNETIIGRNYQLKPTNHEISCDETSQNPQLHINYADGSVSCAACTAGQYFNETKCEPCPKDSYSMNGTCIPCPNGEVTSGIGSPDPRNCYTNCSEGKHFDYATNDCLDCAQGTYQDQFGQLACEQCPDQSTTPGTGSKSSSDCTLCPAGNELNEAETCVPCQNGTYRVAGSSSACKLCQPGFTTPNQQSDRPENCDMIYCPPGTHLKPESVIKNLAKPINQIRYQLNSVCQFCDFGFYQDQYNQTFCISCGPGMTTKQIGAQTNRLCVVGFSHRCDPYNQNSCPDEEICAEITEGNYVCIAGPSVDPLPKPGTPVWVWILIGFIALALTIGIVVLVFVFRKKWMIWFMQTCPWCMAWCPCKKLSPDDLEAEAMPRNDSDARVTRGSSTTYTDVKEDERASPIFAGIPRVEIRPEIRPESTRPENRQEVRTDRPSMDSAESVENPLDEIRDILQYFAPSDPKTRHSPPPTPPPVPQSRLTVQTSLRTAQEDRSHFDFDMRYSLGEAATRRRVVAQSSTQRNELFSYHQKSEFEQRTGALKGKPPSPDYSPPLVSRRHIPESRTAPIGRRRSSSSESQKRWSPPSKPSVPEPPQSSASVENDDDLFFS